jgi:hypothetical protein
MYSYSDNGWTALAHFCNELAPVVGPLLATVAETAHAIDRANRGITTQSLPQSRTRSS